MRTSDADLSISRVKQSVVSLRDVVMPTENSDCASLRSFVAQFFRESDFRSDDQVFELVAQHAVGVKVNLAAIRRFDETIAAL